MLDCRDESPNNPLAASVTRDVDVRTACKIPASATAVVMAMTVAPQGFLGSLNVWATGHPQPATSNINAYDGQKKSNMVIAQLGTNGQVSFFASNATDAVADVVGYFGAPVGTGALTFHPIVGCTKVNTQWADGPDGGPALDANSTRDLPLGPTGPCEVVPGLSVINNGVPDGVPGWARVYSLYALDGQVTASAGIMAAGTGGLTVASLSPTHLRMILSGYFD